MAHTFYGIISFPSLYLKQEKGKDKFWCYLAKNVNSEVINDNICIYMDMLGYIRSHWLNIPVYKGLKSWLFIFIFFFVLLYFFL